VSSTLSPRIYLSAGEASGDLHAAALAAALRRRFPEGVMEATGGYHLREAGITVPHSIDGCGAIGIAEMVASVPRHIALLADLRHRFRSGAYDLLVVVDYPGFHLRLAAAAQRAGVPVLYYIAPQLWAWGERRAAILRRFARELAVILPFEEGFFRRLGISATFVGHPLLDQPAPPQRQQVRERSGISDKTPVLGLFPGSRHQETLRLWPVFRDVARLVRRVVPDIAVMVAGVDGHSYPESDEFLVQRNASGAVLAACDAALCKSGTVTLQAALAGVPMAIAYRLHPLTHMLARRALKIRRIGLVNLVAGRDVAPEFLQDAANSPAIAGAIVQLLDHDSTAARAQRSAFLELRERLGTPGVADRVADIAARLVA